MCGVRCWSFSSTGRLASVWEHWWTKSQQLKWRLRVISPFTCCAKNEPTSWHLNARSARQRARKSLAGRNPECTNYPRCISTAIRLADHHESVVPKNFLMTIWGKFSTGGVRCVSAHVKTFASLCRAAHQQSLHVVLWQGHSHVRAKSLDHTGGLVANIAMVKHKLRRFMRSRTWDISSPLVSEVLLTNNPSFWRICCLWCCILFSVTAVCSKAISVCAKRVQSSAVGFCACSNRVHSRENGTHANVKYLLSRPGGFSTWAGVATPWSVVSVPTRCLFFPGQMVSTRPSSVRERSMDLRVHSYFGMALAVAFFPVVLVSYICWTRACSFIFNSACPAKVVFCTLCCHGSFQDVCSFCRGTFKNMPGLLNLCRVLSHCVDSGLTPSVALCSGLYFRALSVPVLSPVVINSHDHGPFRYCHVCRVVWDHRCL